MIAQPPMKNIADFGMDTITLAGPLPAKLAAVRAAGFGQIMLLARDITGHAGGVAEAVALVRGSGLRVTGFQVLRDFEGLSGHLHDYKVDIARSMIEMAAALGAKVLLACSSTSTHASGDVEKIASDLRKLAMLGLPLGIKIAYEGLSWGRHVNEYIAAWDAVRRADMPNLGLGIDSYHILATKTSSGRVGRSSMRARSFWCSWPTSCGTKCRRWKNALRPRARSACFRARVCTASC